MALSFQPPAGTATIALRCREGAPARFPDESRYKKVRNTKYGERSEPQALRNPRSAERCSSSGRWPTSLNEMRRGFGARMTVIEAFHGITKGT